MKRQLFVVLSIVTLLGLAACAAPTARPIAGSTGASNSVEEQKHRPYPTEAPLQALATVSPRQVYPTPEATWTQETNVPEANGVPAFVVPTIVAPAPNNGMDNYFQDYGVNPMTSTGRDHLSTFALDVDTASYDVTRRYIQEGSLPPMDAVRAEEFINAFDQGYASPDGRAFIVYADGGPSPFISAGDILLRIGVQGYRVADYERKPLNLTFVIDASGSMEAENRLGLVKDSLHLLVNELDERDSVTIVAYSDDAWLVLEPTNGADHRRIDRAIDQLYPTNSTNADAGLRLGYRYAMRMFNPDGVNRVILCSDGVANRGNVQAEDILEYVQGYVDSGITLTGIGVGMGNFNDVLLEQLADHGDGNYYYVNSMEEAHEVFVENLTSTMQVIGYDAKIQIDFNPDVVSNYRLIGYENRDVADEDFRNDSVDAGEIGAGMSAVALYEVQLEPRANGRIATAQLRWQDADTREVTELDGNLYTSDLAPSFEATSAYFQLTSTVAAYAEILRASPYVIGSYADVANEARRIAHLMMENQQANEFADLAQQTDRIDCWR